MEELLGDLALAVIQAHEAANNDTAAGARADNGTVVGALIGGGAVVIGAVIAGLVNFFLQKASDKRRWDREDEIRYTPDRLREYTKFYEATKPASLKQFAVIPDRVKAEEASIAIMQEISKSSSYIEVWASTDEVKNTAARLADTAYAQLATIISAGHGTYVAEIIDPSQQVELAQRHKDFLEAVRKELGVSVDQN